jgi:hypothetical protein
MSTICVDVSGLLYFTTIVINKFIACLLLLVSRIVVDLVVVAVDVVALLVEQLVVHGVVLVGQHMVGTQFCQTWLAVVVY